MGGVFVTSAVLEKAFKEVIVCWELAWTQNDGLLCAIFNMDMG
jgi:hypothetical protein